MFLMRFYYFINVLSDDDNDEEDDDGKNASNNSMWRNIFMHACTYSMFVCRKEFRRR